MVIIESVKPTKIEEKKETLIDLEIELLQMIEQATDKQDGEREKQNNEESKEKYKNEMKEKETENTKVKAEGSRVQGWATLPVRISNLF